MNITVNAEPREVKDALTVAELFDQLGQQRGAVAVAVNQEFVPRSAYNEARLNEGDAVELVAPMQGG